ncbi:transposase [Streptomyces sp. NPDC088258]|uniref:transposase n=1 Tax=Streptomyces sp. NPDC088258 TaxID=3365849 RepID=UPI00382E1F51
MTSTGMCRLPIRRRKTGYRIHRPCERTANAAQDPRERGVLFADNDMFWLRCAARACLMRLESLWHIVTIIERLVPDLLWELAHQLIPPPPPRPQGGGRRRTDDRAVLAAIVFITTTSCAWRELPTCFGTSWQTAHRRFTEWSAAGLWSRLHQATRTAPGATPGDGPSGDLWTETVVASLRSRARGELGHPLPLGPPAVSEESTDAGRQRR